MFQLHCIWMVRIEDGEMYALGRPHSVESEDGAGELAVGGASTDKLLDSMALVVESVRCFRSSQGAGSMAYFLILRDSGTQRGAE